MVYTGERLRTTQDEHNSAWQYVDAVTGPNQVTPGAEKAPA